METHEHILNYDFQKLIKNLETWIDFQHWGFKLVHAKPAQRKVPVYLIVYQSEQCKIRFRWEQDRPYETPSVSASYGRVHAPFDEDFMMWNGEQCWCWHLIGQTINYLDGLSPVEDANSFSTPNIFRNFRQSSLGKSYDQSKYVAKLTAHIWEHYGQQIFNLYDVRQTDSWEKYKDFVKESSKISDERSSSQGNVLFHSSGVYPPFHKIC